MLKKLFTIGMLAGALLLASNANAQTEENEYPRYSFWSNWSIGGTVIYSWEFEHGGLFEWREGSNIGASLFFEKELSPIWSFRLVAQTPGLWKGFGYIDNPAYDRDGMWYDRYGKAGVDFKFDFYNARNGYDPDRKWSTYLLAGMGLTFQRDDVELGVVGMYMQAGIGAARKLCEHSTIFAELTGDITADIPNPIHQWHDMTGMLSIGYMYNFGPTDEDTARIGQRKRLHQKQLDAKDTEIAKLSKDLKDTKAREQDLQNKVDKIEKGGYQGGTYVNNNQDVIDSLQRIIDSYENDKDNYYAMPFSILYAVDQDQVPADQMNKIKAIAQIMKDSDYDFEIIGYCDKSGSKEYNQKLSERRAENVKKLLVNKYGIDEDRLTATGKGQSISFGDLKNAVNRRVSFYRKNK